MTSQIVRRSHAPTLFYFAALLFSVSAFGQELPVPKPKLQSKPVSVENAIQKTSEPLAAVLPVAKPASPIARAVNDVTARLTKGRDAEDSNNKSNEKVTVETCEIHGLAYEKLAKVDGPDACGIANPVRISGLGETVKFSAKAELTCAMAAKVNNWLGEDVRKAAKKHLRTELSGIRVAASYVCRRRNNKPDGKFSEHSFGRALDISFYKMKDGSTVSVEDDWRPKGPKRDFLQAIRKAACNRFSTVLTPEGDIYHQDHMHLDMGCHGKTCTYLICN
ncbi:MAG: extensin family protein [Stappiaceae bacterium]